MTWRSDGPQGGESAKVRADVLPYLRGRVVLDLGCGSEKVWPHTIGVDSRLDEHLFGIQCNPDVVVDDCASMPLFADGCADAVFSSHLLEHIVDYKGALREWWRVLKDGGYLILYLPNNEDDVAHGGYPRVGELGANPDHKWNISLAFVLDGMAPLRGWDLERFERRDAEDEYSHLYVFRKIAGSDVTSFSYLLQQPRLAKTLGIWRPAAYGDAIWFSSVLPHFKQQDYHVTVYTDPAGEEVLRHDPHVDRIIVAGSEMFRFAANTFAEQIKFVEHEEKKYDKFLNCAGGIEAQLLPHEHEGNFHLPDAQRHRIMNRNYIETLHAWLGVPFDRATVQQKFYPTDEERAWCVEQRARVKGPLVLINPCGSSGPKWWPAKYVQQLVDALAADDVYSVVVGDLRLRQFRGNDHTIIMGTRMPIRTLFTLGAIADVVVGEESALINAVAHEPPLKIVLLSHSSPENLTRDWVNTIALEPQGVKCFPCHRIHENEMRYCAWDDKAGAAACQLAETPEVVYRHIMDYLAQRGKLAA